MGYYSNGEMIKYYIREILDKGDEVTTKEIISYVSKKCEYKNIDGDEMTKAMISSCINSLIKKDKNYEKVRRGRYRRNSSNDKSNWKENTKKTLINIVKKADDDLEKCIKQNLMEIDTDSIEEIKIIVTEIKDVLKKAKEIISKYK